MTQAIILCSSILAIALAAALLREHRLRRGLETLLRKLITVWRNQHEDTPSVDATDTAADPADDRLQQ